MKWLALLGTALAAGRALNWRREADLNGQVVLITGGSRGLGFMLAQLFAHEGCKVVICAREMDTLELAREHLERMGADVLAVPCDVSDVRQVEQVVDHATRHFGQVDILVNNAAIIQVAPLTALKLKDFEDAHGTIFWGTVHFTLAVLPQMRQRKRGRIVNITSIGGKIPVPHLMPYTAAKFAATGFSEALHAELLRDGIVVTTIIPGLMRTGSHLNALFKGSREEEFTWFGLSDTLPGSSMSAETAAVEIVQAVKRGDAERMIGLPTQIAVRVQGVVPSAVAELMGWANQHLLPQSSARRRPVSGAEVKQRMNSPVLNVLMTLGTQAAQRLNQDVDSPKME
jgi:NAD(P)-dependent dehydrogenase (short-subunit alcohol dehydrogenase family)